MSKPSTVPSVVPVRAPRVFTVIAALFVAFLLISNIGATKLIGWTIGPVHLVFDGGAILFPLTYVIGDLLSEVYGFGRARRVIILAFATQILASLCFWIVQIATPNPGWENQVAYEAVLGVVPRFVLASLLGFLCGQLLNSYVLVWIKQRFGTRHLWVRLIGSTIVGEAVDTAVFCAVAWGAEVAAGHQTLGTIMNLGATGWFYKVMIEVVMLPITYQVVAGIKRAEKGTLADPAVEAAIRKYNDTHPAGLGAAGVSVDGGPSAVDALEAEAAERELAAVAALQPAVAGVDRATVANAEAE